MVPVATRTATRRKECAAGVRVFDWSLGHWSLMEFQSTGILRAGVRDD